MAKKFRRLAERHGLESMTAASNRLRVHLHAVVSRGVQEGVTRGIVDVWVGRIWLTGAERFFPIGQSD